MILSKQAAKTHLSERLREQLSEQARHCFAPLPWQIAPLTDCAPVVLLTGSAGGGKSRVAAEKVHAYCRTYPKATWLILRKAREWCSRSIVPFFAQTMMAGDPCVTYSKSMGAFFYANGSVIYSGGMLDEKQRESIRSIGGAGGLDGVWLEEANAFSRQDFEEVSGRLRGTAGPYRQILLTTNPGGPRHWIYDLIKHCEASVYYSKATDNPNNPPDYLNALERLTGIMYQRLVLGLWVQSEGVVFDTFDLAVHVRSRPDAEMQSWALAIDEGYTNPAVILLIGIDNDGRWHVAREFYRSGVLRADLVEQAYAWAREYDVICCAVDAAAAGLIADLQDRNLPAEGGKGRVLDGIRALQDRLIIQGDGRPRLTLDPICEKTIGDFEMYAWKPGQDVPEKKYDHSLDALRYLHDITAENVPFGGIDEVALSIYGI